MATDTGDAPDLALGGLVGRTIGDRFELVEVRSSGANTVILGALDRASNEPVTVKLVQPALAESDDFRRVFRRQAEVATALTHPNIARVIAWGDIDFGDVSTVYWVVEHLGGGSLRDLGDRGRLLEASQALVVGLEACRALDAAHQRGIVHTELTPAKMVFGEDRRLRIVDFGFARLLGAGAWADPPTVPTHVARYASPEQALGLEIDATTDVYALTLVLIESVTGSVPFAADSTVATLAARIGKLMPVSADLGSLAAVLERGGRPEAADRSTAAELGKGLVDAASKLPRPEPIPIVGGGLFAASELRRPTDPTGGLVRPDAADSPESASTPDGESAAAAPGEAVAEPAATPGEPAATPGEPAAGLDSSVEEAVAEPAATPGELVEQPAAAPDSSVEERAATPGAVTEEPAVVPDAFGEPAASEPQPDARVEATPGAGDGSFVVLTDVADPPTGAVEVGSPPHEAAPPATERFEPGEPTAPLAVAEVPSSTLYDDERRRRPVVKILLLTLVVLVGLAALSYAGWLLLRTKSFEVPALAGVNQEVALNEIAGNGWRITIERERSDDEPTVDNVIRTAPGPGVDLEEGAAILIVVSDGPELRTLPELTNLALSDAEARLRELRLVPMIDRREFSETVPADSVVAWRVEGDAAAVAGSQVLPETTILLTVSDGPAPRPAPALAGLLVDQATTEVESLQLVLARGDDVFSDTVPAGVVVSQDPAAGTPVPRGGTVTIQVSKGPDLVAIPDLQGLSYTDAEALLLDTGFTIGNLLGTTDGTFVSMTVGGESVEVGQQFRRGTAVDLIFL